MVLLPPLAFAPVPSGPATAASGATDHGSAAGLRICRWQVGDGGRRGGGVLLGGRPVGAAARLLPIPPVRWGAGGGVVTTAVASVGEDANGANGGGGGGQQETSPLTAAGASFPAAAGSTNSDSDSDDDGDGLILAWSGDSKLVRHSRRRGRRRSRRRPRLRFTSNANNSHDKGSGGDSSLEVDPMPPLDTAAATLAAADTATRSPQLRAPPIARVGIGGPPLLAGQSSSTRLSPPSSPSGSPPTNDVRMGRASSPAGAPSSVVAISTAGGGGLPPSASSWVAVLQRRSYRDQLLGNGLQGIGAAEGARGVGRPTPPMGTAASARTSAAAPAAGRWGLGTRSSQGAPSSPAASSAPRRSWSRRSDAGEKDEDGPPGTDGREGRPLASRRGSVAGVPAAAAPPAAAASAASSWALRGGGRRSWTATGVGGSGDASAVAASSGGPAGRASPSPSASRPPPRPANVQAWHFRPLYPEQRSLSPINSIDDDGFSSAWEVDSRGGGGAYPPSTGGSGTGGGVSGRSSRLGGSAGAGATAAPGSEDRSLPPTAAPSAGRKSRSNRRQWGDPPAAAVEVFLRDLPDTSSWGRRATTVPASWQAAAAQCGLTNRRRDVLHLGDGRRVGVGSFSPQGAGTDAGAPTAVADASGAAPSSPASNGALPLSAAAAAADAADAADAAAVAADVAAAEMNALFLPDSAAAAAVTAIGGSPSALQGLGGGALDLSGRPPKDRRSALQLPPFAEAGPRGADAGANGAGRGVSSPLLLDGVSMRRGDNHPRLIVVGDVHGCVDELSALLRLASFTPGDQLLLLGDVVAKGPDSLGAVALARSLRGRTVRGNHDHATIRFRALLDAAAPASPHSKSQYLATAPPPTRWRVSREHEAIARALPTADADWLQSSPWYMVAPGVGHLFVHGGFLPDLPLPAQSPRTMMTLRSVYPDGRTSTRHVWGRGWARLWPGPQRVVFGHDAFRGLQMHEHATGIDTGCVYGGRLTALVLPENRLISVPAKRAYIATDAYRAFRARTQGRMY